MSGIPFEWDRRKDLANRRKHGVGFAEASTVFGDPLSITIPDPDHGTDEERFIIIGMSSERRLLIVVHTDRGERIRLISARSATKHEKRNYEGRSRETPYQ
ncbi:MAG: BrnT family toxin [Bryobacteraceae bacterium]